MNPCPQVSNNSQNLTTIYGLLFTFSSSKLVFPSIQDVKIFIQDNEDVLEMLLQNKIKVVEEQVSINSEKYKVALNNRSIMISVN